ncbi:hypothetical protein [Actinokineospora bangkokensis]|uniref:Uncharacterized protein n=1 Tax=Actinokineospora bangkokensis TaxID=1193682 RepID=A0A1Q9LIL9_9PSEU|nr:hypothetical protein [Actinokineospora bangkokensis]OLR91863.1 hypothetical protein BJP25_23800 [Actinokineospora bangkokensis]
MRQSKRPAARRLRGLAVLVAGLVGLTATAVPAVAGPAAPTGGSPSTAALVKLRVEGATSTIFEGLVITRPHEVTSAAGGTHQCDGTNLGANPTAGPTAIGALDDGARTYGFDWDGPYFPSFEDYLVTRIGAESSTATTFFSLRRNGAVTSVGGCQQRVATGDEVLFAISDGSETAALKLTGPVFARVGQGVVYRVVDAATGAPIAGASVGGATTGADGRASVTFTRTGLQKLKATSPGTIRSNAVPVFVGP